MNRKKEGINSPQDRKTPPLFILAGWSGSGKTTFIERLIPEFRNRGLRVGTIKHHHGDLELDRPGKDSWRHKAAGAEITVISSPARIGMVRDMAHDPGLDELTPYMSNVDIVIVEGYKGAKRPKVEIFRSSVHERPGFLDDPHLIAIVSDVEVKASVPVFDLNEPGRLAEFIIQYFNLSASPHHAPSVINS